MRLPAAGNDLKVETLTYGYDRLGKPATLKTSLDGPTTRPLLCVEDDQGRCHAAVHGSAADRSPRCVTGSGGSDARNCRDQCIGSPFREGGESVERGPQFVRGGRLGAWNAALIGELGPVVGVGDARA
jgi:hypothetical protein